ncbi:MAG: hypothetical protein ACJAWL_001629 [Motiliproteus sp.]|jgi:hypothetical protein
MPISRHPGALTLCFDHLTHSDNIRQSKQHGQFVIILSNASITCLSEAKLAFDNPERMLNFCSDAGFHVFNIDQHFVYSRVLLKRSGFEQARIVIERCDEAENGQSGVRV